MEAWAQHTPTGTRGKEQERWPVPAASAQLASAPFSGCGGLLQPVHMLLLFFLCRAYSRMLFSAIN